MHNLESNSVELKSQASLVYSIKHCFSTGLAVLYSIYEGFTTIANHVHFEKKRLSVKKMFKICLIPFHSEPRLFSYTFAYMLSVY